MEGIHLVDPMAVTSEILGVATGLGGPGHVREIVYDQHDSGMAISYLKQKRFTARETTFTNDYKERMYSAFSQIIQSRKLKVCWDGGSGFADRFMRELEHFRRVQKGDKVYYSHSNSGPTPHDDLLTAVANAVYRLSLWENEPRECIKEITKNGGPPVTMPAIRPARVYHHRPGDIPPKLKDRLR